MPYITKPACWNNQLRPFDRTKTIEDENYQTLRRMQQEAIKYGMEIAINLVLSHINEETPCSIRDAISDATDKAYQHLHTVELPS